MIRVYALSFGTSFGGERDAPAVTGSHLGGDFLRVVSVLPPELGHDLFTVTVRSEPD